MRKSEIIFILVLLIIFSILILKYYSPNYIIKTYESFFQEIEMNMKYHSYVRQIEMRGIENETQEITSTKSMPVLVYHGISESSYKENVLLENFEEQMIKLKEEGYKTITIADFYEFMQNKKELPEKSFLLTFDDGIKSSYYNVDPLLRALDYNAVMFIITKDSLGEGSSYYLSLEEVKKMLDSSMWEIQPHAKDAHDLRVINENGEFGHFLSNKLWLGDRLETDEEYKQRIRKEFEESKNEIVQKLGVDVIAYAFPFGDFGQSSINFPYAQQYILGEIKDFYPLANFYQVWPSRGFGNNYANEDSFMVKRITVEQDWDANQLLEILSNNQEKNLPYGDEFREDNGWVNVWGNVTIVDNSLILTNSDGNAGGFTFLEGTYLWEDYQYKINIGLIKGDDLGMIFNFKDTNNYAVCEFSGNSVRIKQTIVGASEIVAEAILNGKLLKDNSSLGVEVNGHDVGCILDGKTLIETNQLDERISHGGIGLRIWNSNKDSQLIVKEITVF